MASNCSHYAGSPLRPERKEIRVLELTHTGDSGFEASCRLHTVSLLHEHKPRYSALSYVWGDPTATKAILLNGIPHNVTKNLAAALKFLTASRNDQLRAFRLWVDAICINQGLDPENQEKNEQVTMMGDIFANADEVLSWLEDNASIPKAFHTLVMLHKESVNAQSNTGRQNPNWLESYPDLYATNTPGNEKWLIPSHTWDSIQNFVGLPYWSRMWIFQEIVLAKLNKLVFFTPVEPWFISGEDLRLALGLIDLSGQLFLKGTDPVHIAESMLEQLRAMSDLGNSCKYINRVLMVRQHLHQEGLSNAERASLCILSAFRHNTQSTNPLDYYYGLLGVAQLDLKPNYDAENPVKKVCIEFVRAYLHAASGSPSTLLFLHDALGSEAKAHDLPSWAPRYHLLHTLRGRDRGVDYGAGADRGVFEVAPGVGGIHPRIERLKLLVEGVKVGGVHLVHDQPSQDFMAPGPSDACLLDFERRHQGHYVTGISSATAYFGTLMMDEGGGQDTWKNRIMMRCFSGSLGENNAQEEELWWWLKEEFSHCMQDAISRSRDEVLKVTPERPRSLFEQGVSGARRLFEFEGGYLGLALQDVEIGDIVCVLNGSQYPMILRPLQDDLFEFVGSCFVLGLMKGEARAFLATGRRLFHIV